MSSPTAKAGKPRQKTLNQQLETILEGFDPLDEVVLPNEINLLMKHCSDLLHCLPPKKS